jgi:EF hand
VDSYTNHDVIEKAFQECDLNHEGRLTFEEFKMWMQRNPEILDYMESVLPYNGPKDLTPHQHKRETLPHMRRISSKIMSGSRLNLSELAGDIFSHSTRERRATTGAPPLGQ